MDRSRFILAGSLIDGSGAGLRRNVLLTVQGGVISAIGPAADLPSDGRAGVLDLSRCVILPALADCSVSLASSPSVDMAARASAEGAGPPEKAAMLARRVRYCHAHGVLGVADSGDPDGLVERFRKEGDGRDLLDIRISGSDFVKVACCANIEDMDAPRPTPDPDELRRILRRRGGKKAVVVANGRQQVEAALAAGCDAIEQGYAMGRDNLEIMAEKGVMWIPSLLRARNALDSACGGGEVCCRFSQRYLAPGKPVPGMKEFWERTLAEQLEQLRLARELGVTTAVGTGAGSTGIIHGEAVAEEIKLFIRAGYPLAEAIRCASVNGAAFFGMNGLGPIAPGRKATFLITRGTAGQLPRKLSYLEGVYINGAPSKGGFG